MLRERALLLARGLRLAEAGLWLAAFVAVSWFHGPPNLDNWPERYLEWPGAPGGGWPIWLLAAAAWDATAALSGLRRSQRTEPPSREIVRTLLGTGASVAVASVAWVSLGGGEDPQRVLAMGALAGAALLAMRLSIRVALRTARVRGYDGRLIAVVGEGPLADRVAAIVEDRREWGLALVARLRPGEDLVALLDRYAIDEVVFAGSGLDLRGSGDGMARCAERGVSARIVLDLPEHPADRLVVEDLEGMASLAVHGSAPDGLEMAVKRAFDIMFSATVLLSCLPVLLAVAALVRLDDGGPALFVQRRVGRNGREFDMYKFRTMVPDAEARLPSVLAQSHVDGPAFKMRDDPRVTRVGRWLRRTSLDELPQFWNALRGEMSVVGPRPPLIHEAARYEPWQRRRLAVRPGITGLWQVSGRSDLGFEEWVRLDLDYIDRWSIGLDLVLVLRTLPAVVRGRGAY